MVRFTKKRGMCFWYVFSRGVCASLGGQWEKLLRNHKSKVLCNPNKLAYPRIVGAPDFVVEVVSPGNRKMDVVKKRHKYEKAGVREYWMVFPEEKCVKVCLFEKGEEREYTFADKVPVGIWEGKCEVDFSAIYEWLKPLYDTMEKEET